MTLVWFNLKTMFFCLHSSFPSPLVSLVVVDLHSWWFLTKMEQLQVGNVKVSSGRVVWLQMLTDSCYWAPVQGILSWSVRIANLVNPSYSTAPRAPWLSKLELSSVLQDELCRWSKCFLVNLPDPHTPSHSVLCLQSTEIAFLSFGHCLFLLYL